MAVGYKARGSMGRALEWFRERCDRLGHEHGEEGELDCLLQTLAKARDEHKDHNV